SPGACHPEFPRLPRRDRAPDQRDQLRQGAAAVLRAQRGVLEPQPTRALRPEGGVARADRKRLHGMTWLQPGWKDFVALPRAGIRRALSGREPPAPCAGPCRISDPHPTGDGRFQEPCSRAAMRGAVRTSIADRETPPPSEDNSWPF